MALTLTSSEMFQAAVAGILRRLDALKRSRTMPNGTPSESGLNQWNVEIESCAAEMLVAKRVNQFWHALSAAPTTLPGDVGRLQVRHTTRGNGCLILHPEDGDDVPFILVTGAYPDLRIIGWIMGRDGKHPRHWCAPNHRRLAYFVPQSQLQPMDELVSRLEGEPCPAF